MRRRLSWLLIIVCLLGMGGSPVLAATMAPAPIHHIRSDQWMRWKIDTLLQNDPCLDYRGVKVNIKKDGVAVLTGYVLTDFEKAHAAEVAGDVTGIKEVRNNIDVVQYTAGRDGAVAQRVRSQIVQDPTIRVEALDVEAEKGGVILHGVVPTADVKARIGKFVSEVNGVKHVVNDLDVEPVS
jgi:hyperosmotically inducible periplasmic protein